MHPAIPSLSRPSRSHLLEDEPFHTGRVSVGAGPLVRTESPSVLVVEDDEDHASVIGRWLEARGMSVTFATDGVLGAIAAVEGTFDAVVSDVQLPGVSGMLVANQSKMHHPRRPVVVITATSTESVAIEALREGADDYFVKPLVRELFVERIAALVAASRVVTQGKRRTVLAVGAHPDDIEIGVGGTLLRHVASGDRVVVLTLSHGGAGGPTAARRAEATEAARRLGAELVLEDLPDTRISDGPDTVRLIRNAIERFGPDTVYTHSRNENHQDHRAVALASVVASRDVPRLLCYQSPSTSLDFRPARFIDVDDRLDAKLHLIAAYATQTAKCAYLTPEVVRANARYWGRYAGNRLVEPLEIIRDLG